MTGDTKRVQAEALKPCPFCGSAPELYTCCNEDGTELSFMFRCEECGIEMEAEWKHEAIAAWNRRPPEAPSVPVGVKALEWEEIHQPRSNEDPTTEIVGYEASTGFCTYYTVELCAGSVSVTGLDYEKTFHDTEDEAKAAAQSDFEARILAALVATPPVKAAHVFTGNGPGVQGADNCQICGRWFDEPQTDVCRNSPPAPTAAVDGETYYDKGKDAPWFEALSDEDFAREACHMAQDINDTGLGDSLDQWMPFQAVISDAASRIQRLTQKGDGE